MTLAHDFAAARDEARRSGAFVSEGCGFLEPLGSGLERMIAAQMGAYPTSWPDADKRELAEMHLFGKRPEGAGA